MQLVRAGINGGTDGGYLALKDSNAGDCRSRK